MQVGRYLLLLCCLLEQSHAYLFSMKVDNLTPMVGEKTTLTLEFHYDDLEEYTLEEPTFEAFDIKLMEEQEYQEKNLTWTMKQTYQLVAKRDGHLTLTPLQAHVEMIPLAYQERYNRNKYLKKLDIYTHPLTLNVKPLPKGIDVTGDYQLIAHVDKNSSTAGVPIHYKIELQGEGNLKTLDFLTLDIPHVLIYEKSKTALSKDFELLSDRNFTIPAMMLKYYSQKNHSIEFLSTPAFKINIKNSSTPITTLERYRYLLFLILLLLLSYLISLLFQRFAPMDEKAYLIKELKKSKNREILLKKIAPYIYDSKEIRRLIFKLEVSEEEDFKAIRRDIVGYFRKNL